MELTQLIVYSLKLIKSCGTWGGHSFGPTLFCTLDVSLKLERCHADQRDFIVSPGFSLLTILHRKNAGGEWNEVVKDLTYPEVVKTYLLLQQLGLPDRLPRVEGVVDTSDRVTEVSLQISFDQKQFYVNISSSSGGFRGPSGRQLEELFEYIFELAGLENLAGWNQKEWSVDLPTHDSKTVPPRPDDHQVSKRLGEESEQKTSQSILIELEKVRDSLFLARIDDEKLLNEAEFYLGVNGLIPGRRTIEQVLLNVKISSPESIDTVVTSALPGVLTKYIENPPESIPADPDFSYFLLETTGFCAPYWRHIIDSKAMMFRIPSYIAERLRLYAVFR